MAGNDEGESTCIAGPTQEKIPIRACPPVPKLADLVTQRPLGRQESAAAVRYWVGRLGRCRLALAQGPGRLQDQQPRELAAGPRCRPQGQGRGEGGGAPTPGGVRPASGGTCHRFGAASVSCPPKRPAPEVGVASRVVSGERGCQAPGERGVATPCAPPPGVHTHRSPGLARLAGLTGFRDRLSFVRAESHRGPGALAALATPATSRGGARPTGPPGGRRPGGTGFACRRHRLPGAGR
jgi:hypothetical protein